METQRWASRPPFLIGGPEPKRPGRYRDTDRGTAHRIQPAGVGPSYNELGIEVNSTPQHDISEIKRSIKSLESRVDAMDRGFDDRIELAFRRHFETHGRGSRDMTTWVISIATFVLMTLFTLASLALGIWN